MPATSSILFSAKKEWGANSLEVSKCTCVCVWVVGEEKFKQIAQRSGKGVVECDGAVRWSEDEGFALSDIEASTRVVGSGGVVVQDKETAVEN